MARKIIVVSAYNDEPTSERLKKCVAEILVRRQLADWVIKRVSIRRRPIDAIPADVLFAKSADLPEVIYHIPPGLAPRELPGIRFDGPTLGPSLRAMRAGWDWSREPAC